MNVEVEGAPAIAIRIGKLDGHFPIPDTLFDIASFIESSVIGPLIPFTKR
jgi:hypothetical protein